MIGLLSGRVSSSTGGGVGGRLLARGVPGVMVVLVTVVVAEMGREGSRFVGLDEVGS